MTAPDDSDPLTHLLGALRILERSSSAVDGDAGAVLDETRLSVLGAAKDLLPARRADRHLLRRVADTRSEELVAHLFEVHDTTAFHPRARQHEGRAAPHQHDSNSAMVTALVEADRCDILRLFAANGIPLTIEPMPDQLRYVLTHRASGDMLEIFLSDPVAGPLLTDHLDELLLHADDRRAGCLARYLRTVPAAEVVDVLRPVKGTLSLRFDLKLLACLALSRHPGGDVLAPDPKIGTMARWILGTDILPLPSYVLPLMADAGSHHWRLRLKHLEPSLEAVIARDRHAAFFGLSLAGSTGGCASPARRGPPPAQDEMTDSRHVLSRTYGHLCAALHALHDMDDGDHALARLLSRYALAIAAFRDAAGDVVEGALASRDARLIEGVLERLPVAERQRRVARSDFALGALMHELRIDCIDSLHRKDIILSYTIDKLVLDALRHDDGDAIRWLVEDSPYIDRLYPALKMSKRIATCGPNGAPRLMYRLRELIDQARADSSAKTALRKGLGLAYGQKPGLKTFSALLASGRDVAFLLDGVQGLPDQARLLVENTSSHHGQTSLKKIESDPLSVLTRDMGKAFYGLKGL